MKNSILDVALKDKTFKVVYDYGVENGLINLFSKELIDKMKQIYVEKLNCTLFNYFKNGSNIGFCLPACEYFSNMFEEYEIYKGILPAIKNTKRSPNGEHAWIVSNGIIYDTSLLLLIDERLAKYLGYTPQGIIKSKSKEKKNFNAL